MTDHYSRIFLLSHMRAYSSTLGHIIGSHPRINGYYEMHQSYLSDADLAQQIADYSQHDSLKPDSHYQFDKLLHNDYRLNLSLPALQDAVIFIALRQPEPTIKSIIKLFRQKSTDDLYAQPTGATDYYLERLQTLADFAQQHPQRYYYFDTENNLPIATETEIKQGPAKGQKSVSTMSDYQEVDGIYFPFAMNQGGQAMKVKKITLNPTIDPKAYAFPAQ